MVGSEDQPQKIIKLKRINPRSRAQNRTLSMLEEPEGTLVVCYIYASE